MTSTTPSTSASTTPSTSDQVHGLIAFEVRGTPRPQGSYTWRPTASGKGQVIPPRASLLWRERVAAAAELAMGDHPLLDGPVRAELVFSMPRSRGHFGTGRNAGKLKPSAPALPSRTPDIDKLSRSVLDALTSTVLVDDARVVELVACKVYSDPASAGVSVTVEEVLVAVEEVVEEVVTIEDDQGAPEEHEQQLPLFAAPSCCQREKDHKHDRTEERLGIKEYRS